MPDLLTGIQFKIYSSDPDLGKLVSDPAVDRIRKVLGVVKSTLVILRLNFQFPS